MHDAGDGLGGYALYVYSEPGVFRIIAASCTVGSFRFIINVAVFRVNTSKYYGNEPEITVFVAVFSKAKSTIINSNFINNWFQLIV